MEQTKTVSNLRVFFEAMCNFGHHTVGGVMPILNFSMLALRLCQVKLTVATRLKTYGLSFPPSRTECDQGTYGSQCAETCSPFCAKPENCERLNGSCQAECLAGYTGHRCDKRNDNCR